MSIFGFITSCLAIAGINIKEHTANNKKAKMSKEWDDYMAYIKKQKNIINKG